MSKEPIENNKQAEEAANRRGYYIGQPYYGQIIEGFDFGVTIHMQETVACIVKDKGEYLLRDLFLWWGY